MPTIKDEHHTITYKLTTLSDIHFIKIYLDDLNGVHVTASTSKSQSKVEDFLHKKIQWMNQKWQKIHEDLYQEVSLNTQETPRITYLGKAYKTIMSEANESSFSFNKGKFHFTSLKGSSEEEKQEEFERLRDQWFREKAEEKFKSIHKWTVLPEQDSLRLGYKKNQTIYLNWRLIKRSKQKITTVIDDLIDEREF
ncbi:YgjP-like metallopeptidase domain-containing protein [Halobacillus amylolyticus]|uniref:M48 family metallopeptidase n=1 Tax=Halobacillus amylolyticus TaxID=2932259 RepID=A0ABY4HDT3_9BACI|nr:YgjP-like metallopeptidase domain-containing protein [Halobacillus amylolyticus]UOR13060.1 M48 family metallopeptidase [Halobacillus amylolyticus]